jgi:hypothetical protein
MLYRESDFVCHKSLDYEDKSRFINPLEPTGKTRLCAGAKIFIDNLTHGTNEVLSLTEFMERNGLSED